MGPSAQTTGTIIEQLRRRKELVSSTEGMAILDLSRKSLCAWVKAGRIPAYRVGKNNKFDPHDLADWLEQRRIGGPVRAPRRPPQSFRWASIGTQTAQLRQRKGLVSSTEVMMILDTSRKSLCAWVKAGRIPAYRVGKDNKFDPHDVADFLEHRRIGGQVLAPRRPPQSFMPSSVATQIA